MGPTGTFIDLPLLLSLWHGVAAFLGSDLLLPLMGQARAGFAVPRARLFLFFTAGR